MIPEASILLLMEDRGWTEEQPSRCPAWEAAWTEAARIRRSSVVFGQWKYREDAEEYRKIIQEVEKKKADLRPMIERIRGFAEL